MKKKLTAGLFCLCILAALAGCAPQPEPTTPPTTTAEPTEPPLSAREKYDLARQQMEAAANWILDYKIEESRTVGGDTYTRIEEGKASFSKRGSADMMAVVEETLSYGSYSSSYLEIYCEGAAYSQVNQSCFCADMTPEDFVKRQLPAVLLDSSLYQTVRETAIANTTQISFENAKAPESWAVKKRAKLVSASGTALLDSDGVLRESTYQITYTLEEVEHSIQVWVQATAPGALDLGGTHQEHIQSSTKIESLDAPKLLLQAVGDVYASGKVQCNAVESIYSQAIPMAYSQNTAIQFHGRGDTLNARVEYESHLFDYRGNVSTKTQVDAFADGLFTTAQNGSDPQENKAVTADQMRSYCEDVILSALAAPTYLANASLTENGNTIRMEISGNDAFIGDMMKNISQFLQVDLDSKASEATTLAAGGYLEMDRSTGLPTAMGLKLERQHTIDTISYQLTYTLDQTIRMFQDLSE